MKKYLLILGLLFCSNFLSAGGIFGKLSPDAPLKNVLDAGSQTISRLIDQAVRGGDYVLEKNLSRLNVMLDNLRISLSDYLDKKLVEVKGMELQAVNDFEAAAESVIDHASEKYLKAEEFTMMDVNDLLNRIPLIKKHFYLASIEGIGQKFKSVGFYSIRCEGTLFKPEMTTSIWVNGVALNPQDILQTVNKMSFDIPISSLNKYFFDNQLNRASLKIVVSNKKPSNWYNPVSWFTTETDTLLKYSGEILLLPKYPVVDYRLTEYISVDHWSTEIFDSEVGHLLLGPSADDAQWSSGTVSTSVPINCLMIRDQVKSWWSTTVSTGL